jgi:Protein of unknown function (DUF2950)
MRMNMHNKAIKARKHTGVLKAAGFALAAVVVAIAGVQSGVAQEQPKTFPSAEAAAQALFQAVQNHDEAAVMNMLGAEKDQISSGDTLQDDIEHEQFARKYQEMHRLVREEDGTTLLYIGAENWPFPFPLVSSNGKWHFDSQTGTQEVLYRRIGENEEAAIDVCTALIEAKTQTTATENDAITRYAQSLIDAGNKGSAAPNSPFYGYNFRIVPDDPSDPSRKTNGVMAIAYPAKYRETGVMTFMVTQDGRVYQKDLGKDTDKLAQQIEEQTSLKKWAAVK